jgi:chromosome segregation ATPase
MNPDMLIAVVGAIGSFVAALTSGEVLLPLLRRLFGRPQPQKSFSERLSSLTASLTRASGEVDEVLRELAQVARDREAAVKKLEGDLAALEGREKELKDKIEALQKTPLPVAEHFAKLLESGERRTMRRDYLLFGAGVVVTTAITVVL